ncbi:PAS domain-containing protein, partial [Imhoffiella purpurea]|uniref:PAS domain-containing protein n=1 Tax=Imhoffiella purpurea TaxID=1249627 RepID=UPI0005C1D916
MRKNLPVTETEHLMRDDQLIVSRTDLKGRITYANADFVEISGFGLDELIGTPHNLIRHPDMPPAAFEDLWKTIQAGRPWTGIVKNRCKNGDFYWVEANVSPLREQGRVTGYISVRRKPSRDQIDAAETLYARLRAGKPARPLIGRLAARIQDTRIVRALPAGLILISLLFTAAILVSILNLRQSNQQLRHFTEHDQALEQAYGEMYAKGLQMVSAMRFILLDPDDLPVRKTFRMAQEGFDRQLERIRRLTDRADTAGLETALSRLDEIGAGRQRHGELQKRILELIEAGDLLGAKRLYNAEEAGIWRPYKSLMMAAVKQVKEDAARQREAYLADASRAEREVVLVALLALLVAAVLGIWLVRKISGPLRQTLGHLASISDGDYSRHIGVHSNDEMGQMLLGVKSVQARLDYDIQETRRIAQENQTIRYALDHVTIPVSLSDEQDRVTYLNHAGEGLWRALSDDVLRHHPELDPDALMRTCMTRYLGDDRQRQALSGQLEGTLVLDTRMSGRHLHLTASPVRDDRGHQIGKVMQWQDRTAEVTAEREIAGLVEGAAVGDFAARLDLAGKEGFFRQLSEGLNRLLDIMSAGLSDVAGVLDAIARGDLTRG